MEKYKELADRLKKRYKGNETGSTFVTLCSRRDVLNAATAITDLLARAEKAEKERDAAVDHLRQMCVGGNTCAFCKHGRNCGKQGPGRKSVEHCWEWCGQKEG